LKRPWKPSLAHATIAGNYPYPSNYLTSGGPLLPAFPMAKSCEFLNVSLPKYVWARATGLSVVHVRKCEGGYVHVCLSACAHAMVGGIVKKREERARWYFLRCLLALPEIVDP